MTYTDEQIVEMLDESIELVTWAIRYLALSALCTLGAIVLVVRGSLGYSLLLFVMGNLIGLYSGHLKQKSDEIYNETRV